MNMRKASSTFCGPAARSVFSLSRELIVFSLLAVTALGAPAAIPADALHRENPRSAVTAFLEACHQGDYGKAAQYLDLSRIPSHQRVEMGPKLARDLEALLNAASGFDVLGMSHSPLGNL